MKNRSYYFWNDVVYLKNFDPELVKVDKKEPRIEIDLFFIGYILKKPEYNIDSVNPLYLVIRSLEGFVERINGTDDRNLVITSDYVLGKFDVLWKDIEDKITYLIKKDYDKIKFGPESDLKTVSIKGKHKTRFNSNAVLPLNTPITFHALTLVIRCVIEKNSM